MDDATILGLVISALVVLVGLFISLANPLIKLNKTIQRLNDKLDEDETNTKENSAKIETLTKHLSNDNVKLKEHDLKLDDHEKRISHLEEKEK